MPEDIKEKVNQLLKETNKEEIAKKLQDINDLFLTEYKLKVDNTEIIPLETEIYYYNENKIFEDNMIHKNELQESRFGQLYFHRKGFSKNNEIILFPRGGVDICISDNNYYLSILLRSVIKTQDGIENFISGPGKIQQIFYKGFNNEEIRKGLKELENKKEIIIKRNRKVNIANVYHQKRIQGENYKKGENYELNSLNLGQEFEYLKKMIESKQCFYSKHGKEIEGNYGK